MKNSVGETVSVVEENSWYLGGFSGKKNYFKKITLNQTTGCTLTERVLSGVFYVKC